MRIATFTGVLLAMTMVTAPATVLAADFAAGEEYSLSPDDVVAENLYVASGRATVAGRVQGDLVTAGGSVTVTGTVDDDVLAAAGTLSLLGSVGGDVRVAGGQVTVGGTVTGEVVAAGGEVHILPDAIVQGDLHVTGGQVIVDGSIGGEVRVKGGRLVVNGRVGGSIDAVLKDELKIGEDAFIGGALDYRAPREIAVPESALVTGPVNYDGPMNGLDRAAAGSGIVGFAFLQGILGLLAGIIFTLRVLAWLGFAFLIVWLWRRWAEDVVAHMAGTFWRSLGQGLAFFIVAPIAIALLLISFVGTFVGLASIAFYALFLMFARVFAALLLGAWLRRVLRKRKDWRVTPWWTIAGVVGLQVIHLIPLAGWLISSGLSLVALGTLIHMAWIKAHR